MSLTLLIGGYILLRRGVIGRRTMFVSAGFVLASLATSVAFGKSEGGFYGTSGLWLLAALTLVFALNGSTMRRLERKSNPPGR